MKRASRRQSSPSPKQRRKQQHLPLHHQDWDWDQNQFYIAPQASGTAKCFRIKITYHEDTQMSNLRAYSATYALKEFTEDVHYTPEDILTDESSSEIILADGFQMLVRGDFTEEKLHELLDTTSEIRDLLISECTNAEFEKRASQENRFRRRAAPHRRKAQKPRRRKLSPSRVTMSFRRKLERQSRLPRRRKKKPNRRL